MSDRLARLTGVLQEVVHSLPELSDDALTGRLEELASVEVGVDEAFDGVAGEIMAVDYLPANPSHFLDVAKQLDKMSDLAERASTLLAERHELQVEESELLEGITAQAHQMAVEIGGCISELDRDPKSVAGGCASIADREQAADRLRERYYSMSSRKNYPLAKRIWLRELMTSLDDFADLGRDITVTLRVLSARLDRQARLNVKTGPQVD
jgi:uncharacterized protein Yka (UPF0111/DUF47 family)